MNMSAYQTCRMEAFKSLNANLSARDSWCRRLPIETNKGGAFGKQGYDFKASIKGF